MMHVMCAFLVAMCLTGVTASQAHALDVVVGAEAKVQADIQAAGTTVQISGAVRDELGEPLRQHDLLLTISASHSRRTLHKGLLTTDMKGRFEFQQDFGEGDVMVSLSLKPTTYILGDNPVEKEIFLEVRPPDLQVQVPSLVVGRQEPVSLRVRGAVNGVGIKAPVQVFVNDVLVEDSLELSYYGRGALDIGRYLEEGTNEVSVRLPQAKNRPAAVESSTLMFTANAQVSARIEAAYNRLERGIRVHGQVVGLEGQPLGDGHVTVMFEHRAEEQDQGAFNPATNGTVRVDVQPTGSFEAFLSEQDLQEGLWRAQVTYQPDVGVKSAVFTEFMELDHGSSRWLLNTLGILGILFGMLVLAWRVSLIDFESIMRGLREMRFRKKYQHVFDPLDEQESIIVEQLDRPSEVAPPSEFDIGGVVWDIWRHKPVRAGRVQLLTLGLEDVISQCEVNAQGTFVLKELPPGKYALRVLSEGFAPGVMDVNLPHDGSLGYFRLGLVAIPLKMRRFYQNWVRQMKGRDLWGTLTPRQIEETLLSVFQSLPEQRHDERVRQDIVARVVDYFDRPEQLDEPADILLAVTQMVEDAYFSGQHVDERLWHDFVQVIQRLQVLLDTSDEQHIEGGNP